MELPLATLAVGGGLTLRLAPDTLEAVLDDGVVVGLRLFMYLVLEAGVDDTVVNALL